ncbi:MAG TPA: nucleotidyltransferase substrate binding protein [Kiritimatiellia bacterium]|nr:nucleotidyltransferase substrate binding protein [Kiritimatiellia bacterium]
MSGEVPRWKLRFASFTKALAVLDGAVGLSERRPLSDLEKQGMIQAFEFTHELAWNLLKDFYESQGSTGIQGSRDAVRLAFNRGFIVNGQVWMEMIISRNRTTHTYDQKTADAIVDEIEQSYLSEFLALKKRFEEMEADECPTPLD